MTVEDGTGVPSYDRLMIAVLSAVLTLVISLTSQIVARGGAPSTSDELLVIICGAIYMALIEFVAVLGLKAYAEVKQGSVIGVKSLISSLLYVTHNGKHEDGKEKSAQAATESQRTTTKGGGNNIPPHSDYEEIGTTKVRTRDSRVKLPTVLP